MLKRLGNLRLNIQKLIVKKKLKGKRLHVETVLQKAGSSLAEINSLVQEVQKSIESTLQFIDTHPVINASQITPIITTEDHITNDTSPATKINVSESACNLLENAKNEIATANNLLANLLQIQKVILEQEKTIRKERDSVFNIHNDEHKTANATIKANKSCEIIELSTKNIQSVLPAARHHQHQIKNILSQVKKHLEEALNLQPEKQISESELAKNASQAVENALIEINATVEDAHKIIKETKESITDVRHEINITAAAQKLIDAEIELESANTLLKNLAQIQKTIINEGIKIKTEKEAALLQQSQVSTSIVNDLNTYKSVKLAAENIQNVLPSAQQYWQQIRIAMVQAKLYIKEAKELQKKYTEEVAEEIEKQRNNDKVAIIEAAQIAEKSLIEINNVITDAKESIENITEIMVYTRYKSTSTTAAQKLIISEEEIASANILLRNLLQEQDTIVREKEKIKLEKELYEAALGSCSDTDLSAHNANIKLAVQNIQDISSLAEQQWQRIKITIGQAKSSIQEAAELQQAYEEEQIMKEEERRNNERVIAQKSFQMAEDITNEVKKIITDTKTFVEETKGKLTTAAVIQTPDLPQFTQKLISAEGEVASIDILLRGILKIEEVVIREKEKIKSEIGLLNRSTTNISASEELEICKKIKCTTQTLQTLLPSVKEQWQKIKIIMDHSKTYLEEAEMLWQEHDKKETNKKNAPSNNEKPLELFIQPEVEAEIQELKMRIQQQEDKVEQLLDELQELELPIEEDP